MTFTTPTETPAKFGFAPGSPGSLAWTFPAPLQEAKIPIAAKIGASNKYKRVFDPIDLLDALFSESASRDSEARNAGSGAGGVQ
jgi:hypothetical protein